GFLNLFSLFYVLFSIFYVLFFPTPLTKVPVPSIEMRTSSPSRSVKSSDGTKQVPVIKNTPLGKSHSLKSYSTNSVWDLFIILMATLSVNTEVPFLLISMEISVSGEIGPSCKYRQGPIAAQRS